MGTHRAAAGLKKAIADGGGRSSPSAADVRSVALKDQLHAKWRDQVRRLKPGEREAWLRTQEAFVAFGVKGCRELLVAIANERQLVADLVPSLPWLDAWERGERPAFQACDFGRPHGVCPVLSRGRVAVGDGDRLRRYTPPQAVAEEDLIDLMGELDALVHPHPASPSAVVICRWREKNAPPDHGRW